MADTPWGAIAQAGAGTLQSIFGMISAGKAQKDLQKMVNSYKPNEGILQYYNKALSRYNINPYTSRLYEQNRRSAERGLTTGLSSLQSSGDALSGVSKLVQGYNDANLKGAVAAENQQAQALGQLGQATDMKAREEKVPFDMKYNLLAMKAGGANQLANAGFSNIFGGLQSWSNYDMIKKMYGSK